MTDDEFFPVPEHELRDAGMGAVLEPISGEVAELMAQVAAEVRADSAHEVDVERACPVCGSHLRLAFDLGPWSDPFSSTVSGRLYCPADQGHRVDTP